MGRFKLRRVYFRPDRLATPTTRLPVIQLFPDDAWCDDPDYPTYNSKVITPYPARTETLWRDDHLYDIIVVLGHNDAPVVPPMAMRLSAPEVIDELEAAGYRLTARSEGALPRQYILLFEALAASK